jgi:hypothetical protein
MRQRTIATAAGVLVAAGAALSRADFITPDDYGWSRGDAGSTYFGWDIFVSTTGGNEPDAGQFPDPLPSGWVEPDVIETTGDAFVTGSGRIYSPFGPINVEVTVPNYDTGSGQTTLLLQVRTIGFDLDFDNVVLDGSVLPVDIVELSRQTGSMGDEVDTLFVFEVDGNAPLYVFDIPTAEAHVSIDAISVDTLASGENCVADFNGDGAVNTQDVIGFLNAWVAGDSRADINGDGAVNTQDVIGFLNLWVAGC